MSSLYFQVYNALSSNVSYQQNIEFSWSAKQHDHHPTARIIDGISIAKLEIHVTILSRRGVRPRTPLYEGDRRGRFISVRLHLGKKRTERSSLSVKR